MEILWKFLRGQQFLIFGTGAGLNWEGYENFSKANSEYINLRKIFEHCGMKSCTYWGMKIV